MSARARAELKFYLSSQGELKIHRPIPSRYLQDNHSRDISPTMFPSLVAEGKRVRAKRIVINFISHRVRSFALRSRLLDKPRSRARARGEAQPPSREPSAKSFFARKFYRSRAFFSTMDEDFRLAGQTGRILSSRDALQEADPLAGLSASARTLALWGRARARERGIVGRVVSRIYQPWWCRGRVY